MRAAVLAIRHLVGLSQEQLAAELGVTRHAVKDWESGRFTPKPGVVLDMGRVLAAHDADTEPLIRLARDGMGVPWPTGPRPAGWYVAVAARVLAAVPDAVLLDPQS
jgi:DNA-binding XRE family transcriptional regulator